MATITVYILRRVGFKIGFVSELISIVNDEHITPSCLVLAY